MPGPRPVRHHSLLALASPCPLLTPPAVSAREWWLIGPDQVHDGEEMHEEWVVLMRWRLEAS